ncbi:GNAT family N-acetyltransferase [uncultured Rummeliibacillus sp.]|uniref:GNAT family N-acetyltransferase n=1 Tax=uncultured Rummeliibacillus sp. TaxID=762292 RepID=UPI00262A9B47|nr:GNAT family N-acetyltransferase [uncultured Rummeliibacillus sp.]
MMNLKDILALDFAYLDTFSTRTDTSWGALFCNENQPNYYDANHAHISEASYDPISVIEEVKDFYISKNIIPRFYIYNLDVQQDLLALLKSNNFGYEEFISPVQLWDNHIIKVEKKEQTTIEKVTEENYEEALEIECSIKEFGGKEIMQKAFEQQFNHPAFTHYLLRYDGKPCSTACIFEHNHQARLESVATLEAYRGKGFIGELIQFVQTEMTDRGIQKLWVFPINENIEKVYQKYGFQTVDKLKTAHAFLGGKSLKDIQG